MFDGRLGRVALIGTLVGGGTLVALSGSSATTPTPGNISTVAGISDAPGNSGNGGPATAAKLKFPEDAVTDLSGNMYIADNANCQVRKVATNGVIATVAGNGTCGNTGIPGVATSAEVGPIKGVAVDAVGNLYLTDRDNHRVLKVSPAGSLSVFAGTGISGNTGNGGPATAAELNGPWGIRVDTTGNVYFSDATSHVVRKVDTTGTITTVAGNGTSGSTGNGGPATSAELADPTGLWIDASGNLFIADESSSVIRLVDPSGKITTVAGNGTSGSTGNGGPATSAELNAPYGVTEDNLGNLYIGDYGAANVRKVTKATGIISAFAGSPTSVSGSTGDGGPAASALLEGPSQVFIDQSGNLLINDFGSSSIRQVALAAPTGQGYWLVASDGGIFAKGSAGFFGSTGNIVLNKPIVGMARTPDGQGYWLVASDGGIFAKGSAGFFGSTGNIVLNKPIVGMARTPDGQGYWLVASDGGIFAKGDAGFFGSTGNLVLNKPIVGMAATPDGKGYWLVASDGGIFAKGDAGFFGSTGNIVLNKPIVGMAATPDGLGYWLVASDGGIFAKGSAGFFGSTGNIVLNKPIVGMAATPDGLGYWLVASDGGIFAKGDAGFFGSTGNIVLNKPIVGMAPGL